MKICSKKDYITQNKEHATIFDPSSSEGLRNHESIEKNALIQYGQERQHDAGLQGKYKHVQRLHGHWKESGQADVIKVRDGPSTKASSERRTETKD
jgi:hypothetical protein